MKIPGLKILFALLCFGCTAAHAAELRTITLGLVSPNLSTQLPIVVAQQAGFFKGEGLSVHSVTIASALLDALGVKGEPERFFDRSFLSRAT